MINDKNALFEKAPIKSKTVAIDSLGGEELEVTEMTLRTRQRIQGFIAEDKLGDLGELVASECVPILKGVEPAEIGSKLAPAVLDEIIGAVFSLSGMSSDDDSEDAPKN